MKVYTSYFYQLRFFKPYMIGLSTAMWDPKWFHNGKGQNWKFKDQHGVWNGLRADPLVPGPICNNLCRGREVCKDAGPDKCEFLAKYLLQLRSLDCKEIIGRAEALAYRIQALEGFKEEPVIVFLFHETPKNPCSERWKFIEWLRENGIEVEEWNKNCIDS